GAVARTSRRRLDLRRGPDPAQAPRPAGARRHDRPLARGSMSAGARNVAVDVVTGFLGSGKTTLLRHVLEHGLKGKPVALGVNEIGDVGIDGRVVTRLHHVEKMVELSSGCICCSIEEYRFDLAIQEIIETVRPHVIVIESTGLADPDPLAYRVRSAGLR